MVLIVIVDLFAASHLWEQCYIQGGKVAMETIRLK